jgi:hypothetical protein
MILPIGPLLRFPPHRPVFNGVCLCLPINRARPSTTIAI